MECGRALGGAGHRSRKVLVTDWESWRGCRPGHTSTQPNSACEGVNSKNANDRQHDYAVSIENVWEGIYAHNNSPQQPRCNKGNFFRDGRIKIDFVLVWEVKILDCRRRRSSKRYHDMEREDIEVPLEGGDEKQDKWRKKFVLNLQKAGLLMEEEVMKSEKKHIHYLKLSAPWDVLVYYAEELCMRAPLQARPVTIENWSERLLGQLNIPNILHQDVPNKPLSYYTCLFRKSKISRFLGSENRDAYFSTTQRQRIVYEILAKTVYGKRKRAEIGIDRLMNEGAYSAAFPLHEGPYDGATSSLLPEKLNARQVLYSYWAHWGCWFHYQPLDHIREYFGEKIAIYFAWLGAVVFLGVSQ